MRALLTERYPSNYQIMETPRVRLVALFIIFFSSTIKAADSVHTGYWKRNTPIGSNYACEIADNQTQFFRTLRSTGWSGQSGVPVVNWNTDLAVIISPDKYYKNKEVVFWGLFPSGKELKLEYGWKKIRKRERAAASTITLGSRKKATAETIVVAFPRKYLSKREIYCYEFE